MTATEPEPPSLSMQRIVRRVLVVMLLGVVLYGALVLYRGLSDVGARFAGACVGFLWWNAAPAKIIMGDVGSQALGGGMAALALLTNTHLLLAILGGLYVMVAASVILQVASFRLFGTRIFRMAPLHHHFELGGWPETTVIIRFWLIAAICVAVALGIFIADFTSEAAT